MLTEMVYRHQRRSRRVQRSKALFFSLFLYAFFSFSFLLSVQSVLMLIYLSVEDVSARFRNSSL